MRLWDCITYYSHHVSKLKGPCIRVEALTADMEGTTDCEKGEVDYIKCFGSMCKMYEGA